MGSDSTLRPRTPLPLFALLEWPYGMSSGVVAALPLYVMRSQGVSLEKAAAITALCLTPATFYFLYAPLVDFFIRRRTWYLVTLLFLAVLTGGTILIPASTHLQVVTALLFSGIVVSMLLSAATGGIANQLGSSRKKSVGAWMQAGNQGGAALMTALLVYGSSRCSRSALAMLAMSAILLPGLTVLFLSEPAHIEPFETFSETMSETWFELRSVFLSWRAVPAILLLLSPIGNGDLSGVMMGLTKTYHATEAQLTFANGWGGGASTALGALCTLLIPKAWNRMLPYALVGVVYGVGSLAIGLLPLTPTVFVTGLLLNNFLSGMAYGVYTGVVLQTAGLGGLRHSTRYSILNSIGNVAVVYMMALLGFVAGHKGVHAAGVTDGLVNFGTAFVFFAWWSWARVRSPSLLEAAKIPDEAMHTA